MFIANVDTCIQYVLIYGGMVNNPSILIYSKL